MIFREVVGDSEALAEMLRLTEGSRRVPVLLEEGSVSIGYGGS